MRRASYVGQIPGLGGDVPVGAIVMAAANPNALKYQLADGGPVASPSQALAPHLSDTTVFGGFNNVNWSITTDTSDITGNGNVGGNLAAYMAVNGRHFAVVYNAGSGYADLYSKPNAASTTWSLQVSSIAPWVSAEWVQVVYFGGLYYVGNITSNYLMSSSTGAGSWTNVTAAGAYSYVSPFVCDGRLYTGGFNGKSTPDGTNWTAMTSSPDGTMAMNEMIKVGSTYYLRGFNRGEIYYTTGNPVTGAWTLLLSSPWTDPRMELLGTTVAIFRPGGASDVIYFYNGATQLGTRTFTQAFGGGLATPVALTTTSGLLFISSDWKWAHLTAWNGTAVPVSVRTYGNSIKAVAQDTVNASLHLVTQNGPSDQGSTRVGALTPRVISPNSRNAYMRIAA
ncbi:hypothetical protein [Caulobacter sp. BP25]|uniref:hypothetical protein n=1 Tax=Caulobacter sp. BP25 TaxID=2048900 RepID=UPI000C12DFD6|nr:hypothetical protein [Caulobacter sp. BP25]PHY20823.1 hypothetical protein CSW59_06255 [Caulobacter sp. BP25]